jgi:hypothetical protein
MSARTRGRGNRIRSAERENWNLKGETDNERRNFVKQTEIPNPESKIV